MDLAEVILSNFLQVVFEEFLCRTLYIMDVFFDVIIEIRTFLRKGLLLYQIQN